MYSFYLKDDYLVPNQLYNVEDINNYQNSSLHQAMIH